MQLHLAACTMMTGVLMLNAVEVLSQNYPVKPIRIVTATAGGTDFSSRLVANGLTASTGWPVIVDNRPGSTPQQLAATVKVGDDHFGQSDQDGGIRAD